MKLPKKRFENGIISSLLLVFLASVLVFIALTFILSFKKEPLPTFYPKPSSHATVTVTPASFANAYSYGIHSFIDDNYSIAAKLYLLDAAKRTGKEIIRFGIPMHDVYPLENYPYNWPQIDGMINEANTRGLNVLATLNSISSWAQDVTLAQIKCGANPPKYAGPLLSTKEAKYTQYVKDVVSHYPTVHFWEIEAEPDLNTYCGRPKDYARELQLAYGAVKAIRPNDQVLIGGATSLAFEAGGWADQVFNANLGIAKSKFDVANVHIRGDISFIASKTQKVRNYYTINIGRSDAPLWITEHGYTAEYQRQSSPSFIGTDVPSGETAQSEYYKQALPAMLSNGAKKIFVTLRDYAHEQDPSCIYYPPNATNSNFCAEGLVTFPHDHAVSGAPFGIDRPSMTTFQNKVLNTGCEYDTFGWQAAFFGTLSQDTTHFHSAGGASCQVTSTGGTYALGDSPDSVFNPILNDQYTAIAWVRSDNAVGTNVRFHIRTNGGATATKNVVSAPLALSTSWQQLTVSMTVDTADRDSLDIYIQADNGTSGQAFQADDIVLLRTGP